jgi:hypothetical protein
MENIVNPINESIVIKNKESDSNLINNVVDEFLFHGTGEGAFRKIREMGLIPQQEGKYLYFSNREGYAKTYASRKGNSFGNRILRVKKTNSYIGDTNTGLTGDFKIKDKIDPHNIEIKYQNKWIPIQEYHDENIGIMPISKNISENKESDSRKYQYGCLMVDFNIPIWNKFTDIIKPEDVYDEPGFGIENFPHTTILFGFHNEVTFDDLLPMLKRVKEPIKVELTGISHFSGPDYDVVKFDVDSKTLKSMNNKCKKFPYTNNFPEYHPHITLCYVKKGEGKKYDITFTKPVTITSSKFSFSNDKKEKFYYQIEPKDKNISSDNDKHVKPEDVILTETKKIKIKNEMFVKKDVDNLNNEQLKFIKMFIDFAVLKLKMKNGVKVLLQKNRDHNVVTTGSYNSSTNEIYVKCGNRSVLDIGKTICHEIIHSKQMEDGLLHDKSGEDGSKEENIANAGAGILARKFGKLHPEIYDL